MGASAIPKQKASLQNKTNEPPPQSSTTTVLTLLQLQTDELASSRQSAVEPSSSELSSAPSTDSSAPPVLGPFATTFFKKRRLTPNKKSFMKSRMASWSSISANFPRRSSLADGSLRSTDSAAALSSTVGSLPGAMAPTSTCGSWWRGLTLRTLRLLNALTSRACEISAPRSGAHRGSMACSGGPSWVDAPSTCAKSSAELEAGTPSRAEWALCDVRALCNSSRALPNNVSHAFKQGLSCRRFSTSRWLSWTPL
mmetsp:Transcript_111152/g.313636  ORF Transcript_111152/g.313636 Transcript_111152/m.313636 type:complete len:254 (+) Transcript_111152:81-842(+)